MSQLKIPSGFTDATEFPLFEAIFGRRSRRFFRGAQIPDGVFAYKSKHPILPLSDLEKNLIIAACASNTSWHHLIYRAQQYAPHLPNYSASASGRSFPSSAGFHTSMTFFTDDNGVYVLNNRDAQNISERKENGQLELTDLIDDLTNKATKISNQRLSLPPEIPYAEPHNTWVVNHPGTFLVIPVGNLSEHLLLNLCYMLQNGKVIYDDINKRPIPGIAHFSSLVNPEDTWNLTFVEQWSLCELTTELSSSCYAGTLALQAMGLGGWMFNGLDAFSVLGASEKPDVKGLGFRYDTSNDWPYPNVTGLPGIMEGYCPPYYHDMRGAVEAICERKFGPGGPFHEQTPGPWKDSAKVRSSAQIHDEQFRQCVALQAQYILDTFGKFPGTTPSIFCFIYLQAHHLDLDFYDSYYKNGAYLQSHADHISKWHSDNYQHDR
ncbi:MAG: hypothetical protein GX267_17530 [Fibrobacter sp.]|jgi:hypothetical protein|nr:hypothetical protein [Fibrobacter sp.]